MLPTLTELWIVYRCGCIIVTSSVHMLPAILCLALLPTLCLSSGSVDVYLYPPAPSRPQPNGLAFLAYHLGLEAYSVQESTGQIQLGAARPFVGEGRRDTLVVSVDANHPSGTPVIILVTSVSDRGPRTRCDAPGSAAFIRPPSQHWLHVLPHSTIY